MSICDNCENLVIAEVEGEPEEHSCMLGICSMDVIKCSHFKQKSKGDSKESQKAKSLADKR